MEDTLIIGKTKIKGKMESLDTLGGRMNIDFKGIIGEAIIKSGNYKYILKDCIISFDISSSEAKMETK